MNERARTVTLCYSFLLDAESTSGPQCGRNECVKEKFQWYHRESNPLPKMCYCIIYYYCKPRYISFTAVVCSYVLQLRFTLEVIV